MRQVLRQLALAMAMGALFAGAPALRSQPQSPAPTSGAKAQAAPASSPNKLAEIKIAEIKSVRIVQEKDGQAVEILSTRPVVPSIQALSNPERLVIDLPNARADVPQKRISVGEDRIDGIRTSQFQENPPTARVVLDLLAPRQFTWDAAGNRLVVHLGKSPVEANPASAQTPAAVALTSTAAPVVASVKAASPSAVADLSKGAGSTVTAGPETAVLGLSRGGEVDVCPGTTVAVTPAENHHNVLLSMNTGAMETNYPLDASSDAVLTPDFRILMKGPGRFHYAISADQKGDTCVRALPGNTASAVVTEVFGDRTYAVGATDQLLFHGGHIDRVDMAVPLECGCPPPRDSQLMAKNVATSPERGQAGLPPVNAKPSAGISGGAPAPTAGVAADSRPAQASAKDVRVQIEAPFVFHGDGPPPQAAAAVAAPKPNSQATKATPAAAPPPASGETNAAIAGQPKPRKGLFRKIGAFFSGLFH